MKKLIKLLALALAAAMLLPTAALAAENSGEEDGPKLVVRWLDWDDQGHCYASDDALDANSGGDDRMGFSPVQGDHLIFFVQDGSKKTPVIPTGDDNLAVIKVDEEGIKPGAKQSDYYVRLEMKEFKDSTLTAQYNGKDLTFPVTATLPEIALYSAPEATPENLIEDQTLGFSPLIEDCSAYIICTATDETRGRHMVDLAFAEDCADKDSFKLEKVSDNVYKVALTGSVDVNCYNPRMTITWQDVSFLGGNTYSEPYDFWAWERASLLFSEKDVPAYDREKPTFYHDVEDQFSGQLTLKAGESKDIYVAFTFFEGDGFDSDNNAWVMRNMMAQMVSALDDNLKLSCAPMGPGLDSKVTVSSDVPGTYEILYAYEYPDIKALYHADGTKYTDEQFEEWFMTPFYVEKGQFYIVTDLETFEHASFEEVFPGEKIDVDIGFYIESYHPITVTVEAAEPEKLPFTDVEESRWYAPIVRYVNNKGYMTGNTETTFNPTGNITGGQFAQILYNKAGKPAAADGAAFQGVASQWYAPAILWAAGEGLITDTGDAALVPTENLTRQQIALMLYNYMGKPEAEADMTKFADADQISAWAKDAMEWAVSAKVFAGSADGDTLKLNPTATATRAQVAQILMNYFG